MIRLRIPQAGDLVAILSPSSPADSSDYQDITFNCLHFGYVPVLMPHLNEAGAFLAGPDDHRASDFNDAIRNPELHAILPLRGGYGAARILPLLDWEALRQNPRLLLGFSDITALHLAFFRHGLPSLHGPNFGSRLGDFSREALERALSAEPLGDLPAAEGGAIALHGGAGRGPLVGGNLAVFVSLWGTPWMPKLEGSVLFFEDVNEAPYRVDRLLTQLRLAGAFEGIRGVAFGQFTAAGDDGPPMVEVLAERTHGLGVPVVANLAFGHVRNNATLPVGSLVEINAATPRLTALESPFQ